MRFQGFRMKSPIKYSAKMKDPRTEWTSEHLLQDIIFIAIAAAICGGESWNDIENYGKAKELWLKKYLGLPNGIPSHDTFNRVFSALDPEQFESCFVEWIKEVAQLTNTEVVSIDGKTLRGTTGRTGKALVHMVSAWATDNSLVLGQVKVDDKSNEITAIPRLLEVLELSGCIVTIDAMGCQTAIAEKIVEKGADYILAVKGNQPGLEQEALRITQTVKPTSRSEQEEKGHGRIETRNCFVYDVSSVKGVFDRWKDVSSLIKIETGRYTGSTGKYETQTRLYISSLRVDAQKASEYVRSHWNIENRLHWTLDVSFNEDQSRKRAGYSARNFSIINRIALNLLKNDKTKKRSVKGKRLDAGWDNDFLLNILHF
jgi:predicted transposase YbfD/YdcC